MHCHCGTNRVKNKTNHPISSNSHPSATANKAIYSLKIAGGGFTKPTGTSYNFTKYEALHPTAVLENSSSSGMLIAEQFVYVIFYKHTYYSIRFFSYDSKVKFLDFDRDLYIKKLIFLPLTISDLSTDQTFHQFDDFGTKLDLHRIMSGYHGALATGMACQQGTLTLPDTWLRPTYSKLSCAPLVKTRFHTLAMSLLDFSP